MQEPATGLGAQLTRSPGLQWLGRVLVMAVVHASMDYLLGVLTRQATVSSGLALGSGFSLAFMLKWGWRLWPGVFLSQVGALGLASLQSGPFSPMGALGFGAAETLQDLLAWWLLRRWAEQPAELNQPRDALVLVAVTIFAVAPVGALCSIGTFVLAYGVHDAAQLRGMWIDVWLVSARAILIGVPSTLALLAVPRKARAAQLLSVAMPLLLATLLLFGAMSTVARWDKQQQGRRFEQDATQAAATFDRHLAELRQMLAATRGLLLAAPGIDAQAFRAGSEAVLADAPSGVRFVGQALVVRGARDARDAPHASSDDRALVMRLIAPAHAEEEAAESLPALGTWHPEWATDQPTASQAVPKQDGGLQVVLLQPLGDVLSTGRDETVDTPPRLAMVSVDIAATLNSVLSAGLRGCLTDEDPQTQRPLLVGDTGCEASSDLQLELRRDFAFGGRHWALRLYSATAAPFHNSPVAQLFGGLGLAVVALLVVLLLTLSARTSRIESLVEQRALELNRTLQQVDEHEHARLVADAANRAKSEFLSRMSHELRTPLNALLGFTQLLQVQREPLTETQRSWIDRIGQAGWYLLAMINDVLDLSRVETGNLKIALEPLDALEIARECLTLLSPLAARHDVSVQLTTDPAARYVVADANRLRGILNNLVSNAVKYNVKHGEVHLQLQVSEPGWVDLSVSDTGRGLTPEQIASLFEPFNRLGQEAGSIEGTGIGLVITRRLAELMNGRLSVSSQPGQGSVFTLHLPASDARAVANLPARSAQPRERPAPGAKRLVYIEDNLVNIEVMRAVIGLRSEFSLTVYERGEAGLDALLQDPPDLLLLDVNLPDMDGLTLLNRLRAAPQCAKLPVVIVSADAMDEHVAKGMHKGATHYLTKPFAVPDLMQLLDRLMGGDS